MKRYLVFMGMQNIITDKNYSGGWSDFHTSFDNVENCFGYIGGQHNEDWWQIVDSHTGKIIHSAP